jgi:hypothetical protein
MAFRTRHHSATVGACFFSFQSKRPSLISYDVRAAARGRGAHVALMTDSFSGTRRDLLQQAEYATLANRNASLVTALAVLEEAMRQAPVNTHTDHWANRLRQILDDHPPDDDLGPDTAVASLLNLRRRFAHQLDLAAQEVKFHALHRGLPETIAAAIAGSVGDISVADALALVDRESEEAGKDAGMAL